jgi:poly(3-hydroxybutyrate) depolymerase
MQKHIRKRRDTVKLAARAFLILTIMLMGIPVIGASAAAIPTDAAQCTGTGGVYSSTPDGSNFCAWAPSANFTGDLVVFAHGYVAPTVADGSIPWDQLAIGGVSLPAMVMGQLHAAFAVTSYPHNGLSVLEGVESIQELALTIRAMPGITIHHVYVVGASEGGLVTALAIEQNPNNMYSGGVSTCGPIGDFTRQIDYWGDFRVAYDYYFQRTSFGPSLPLTPISIAPATIGAWGAFDPLHPTLAGPLQGLVYASLGAHPNAALSLVNAGSAPYDLANPTQTIPATILGILDYNVRATNQGRSELSGYANAYLTPNVGNPYGNSGRWIGGFGNFALNAWVQAGNDKFVAAPAALSALKDYQTTGRLKAPLVTLHTTGDPIVPFWHEFFYLLKAWKTGNGSKLITIPVQRYGHCAFTPQEAMFAYLVMVFKATGSIPALPTAIAPSSNDVLTAQQFDDMMKQYSPTMQQSPNTTYLPLILK